MHSSNPFAPPAADLDAPGIQGQGANQHLWRDGKILVMREDARLPNRCIKCGATPSGKPVERTLRWHPSWVYLFVLINLLIYLLVGAITSKKATVAFRVCDEHRSRRMKFIFGGLALCLASIGGCAVTIDNLPEVAVLSMGTLIAGVVMAVVFANELTAKRIDGRFVHLRGVGEAVLSELPAWDPRIKS